MSAPATYEPAFSPWGLPPGVAGGGPHSAGPYTGYPTGNQPPWATPPKRRKSKREYRRRSSSRRRADNGYDDDSADDGHVVEDGWINVGTMRRAASQGTPVRRGSMHRTASSGGAGHPAYPSVMYGQTPTPGGQVPGYLQADIFNEQNLARRPRDWRADYTPKSSSGISSLLSLGKNRSDVKDYVDNMRRTLHPLLHYQPGSTPISYDMHVEPSPFSIDFPNLRRQPNEIDFAQLAVQPSAEFMRLFHPRLPWYIDVVASHPNGITLFNILSTIYRQLHTPIQPRHYYNEELNAADRAELTSAFETRCKGDLAVIMHGILHIDFLGRRTVFEGLVRGPKGPLGDVVRDPL